MLRIRLIDADALLEKRWNADTRCGYVQVVDIGDIEEAPTVDAVEVKHGRWIIHTEHFAPYQKCSVCGFEIPLPATEDEMEICLYKHCPECISRMDNDNQMGIL